MRLRVSDVLQIGRYQLENLVREGVRFLFIDFRSEAQRTARAADPLLAKTMPMSTGELHENLKSNQVPLDAAILLLDETGESSVSVATTLELQGYKNVYVIRGGAAGL